MKERVHDDFRWWYEYAGGKLTAWGARHNDIAQWALGADDSGPVHVAAVGLPPVRTPNSFQIPEHFTVTCTYADGTRLVTTSDAPNGNKFEGEKGWIFVDRGRIEASEPKLLEEPVPKDAVRLARCGHHMLNFFSCVRSRNRPVSDAEVGHRSATVCLLGNIALRLGHELTWDPVSERFTGARAAEANAMLSRPMRSPWTLEA